MSLRDKMMANYERLKGQFGGQFNFLKMEKGKTYEIRIIPYGRDDDGDYLFFHEQIQHYMADNAGIFTCPRSVDEENECPICEWAGKHHDDDDERKKAVARKIKQKRQFMLNVLPVIGGNIDVNPHILRLTPNVFLDLIKYWNQKALENMVDPMKGNNVRIDCEATGPAKFNVKYRIEPIFEFCPISKDKEKIKEILKRAYNLKKIFSKYPEVEILKDALSKTLRDREFIEKAFIDWKAMQVQWKKKQLQEEAAKKRVAEDNVEENNWDDDEEENVPF